MWLLRGLLLLCAIINAEVLGVPEAAEDQASTSSARAPERDMACDLEQKGLHMRLRCSLTPTARGAWDQCTISIDLARGTLDDVITSAISAGLLSGAQSHSFRSPCRRHAHLPVL